MKKKEYFYWQGRLGQFDELPDGAWWAACEGEIGGYDKFMDYLQSSKIHEPELYAERK